MWSLASAQYKVEVVWSRVRAFGQERWSMCSTRRSVPSREERSILGGEPQSVQNRYLDSVCGCGYVAYKLFSHFIQLVALLAAGAIQVVNFLSNTPKSI